MMQKPASLPKQCSAKDAGLIQSVILFLPSGFRITFLSAFSKRLSVQSAFISRCGKQLIQLALVVHLYFYDPCGISIFVDVFR